MRTMLRRILPRRRRLSCPEAFNPVAVTLVEIGLGARAHAFGGFAHHVGGPGYTWEVQQVVRALADQLPELKVSLRIDTEGRIEQVRIGGGQDIVVLDARATTINLYSTGADAAYAIADAILGAHRGWMRQ